MNQLITPNHFRGNSKFKIFNLNSISIEKVCHCEEPAGDVATSSDIRLPR
jgi:hypothetical protein